MKITDPNEQQKNEEVPIEDADSDGTNPREVTEAPCIVCGLPAHQEPCIVCNLPLSWCVCDMSHSY